MSKHDFYTDLIGTEVKIPEGNIGTIRLIYMYEDIPTAFIQLKTGQFIEKSLVACTAKPQM